jgi:hypothetical protein
MEDWRTKRYALLMVAYDGEQARAASGASINIDHVLQLDKAMADIRLSAPVPRRVEIAFADAPDTCPSCGWSKPAAEKSDEPTPPTQTPIGGGGNGSTPPASEAASV